MKETVEKDSLYYNNSIVEGNVIAFLKIDNKNVVVYKEKNSEDLLASFYTMGSKKEEFILEPIVDEKHWKELERILNLQ